jgi:tRNA pseudouridine65 synthase
MPKNRPWQQPMIGGSFAALPALVVPILERRPGFVVVAKPAGLVVHRSDRSRRGSLALLQILRDQLGAQLNPVHRLDAGTSGCLIFAEDTATTAMLQRALASDGAQKTYYAMVRGNAAAALGEPRTVARPIGDDKGVRRSAATELWCPAGCSAEDLPVHANAAASPSHNLGSALGSNFPNATASPSQNLGPNLGSSLVVAKPKTGRWHQIRKHLSGLSHPILNDGTHGDSRVRAPL